ncbi:MAG: thiamine phosphate synthase [Methanomassiliicoccaceae archaeon]|nr:thiamine phosphate synthase [Methanomassiliicoccaceae archaeon]
MIVAITDRKISAAHDFLEQVEAIAAASPDMIILREKDVSETEYGYLAVECARICCYHNVKFCVNSFIKTAAAVGSGRIQISFGSLLADKDELTGNEEIWVSVHSLSEAVEAERLGATHLIYGNVFETSCKPGAPGRGVGELEEVCGSVRIPVYAVGGIDADTAAAAMKAGCKGVCVRSLLMTAKDPSSKMKELRKSMEKV